VGDGDVCRDLEKYKKYFSWPFLPLKCEGKCIVNVKKVLL
jgi:hypothetical protein